ncbi:MAG: hypothetical protein COU90_01925 [Candidatus Ryanbacteria bacterium CG10_big_fil_rev_8_21_14_0_10_43_42]|uniref:BioF2-like acetyltransferase domain-containing protein n=1 Tax=Candidatus Ryanbacteria bacterium CG10_big_fil_rev_8_21_14_0_10_43_42 TaxID=1974864 RepID=A0A2M8KXB4_9BACT|nr:MAG: hypothetical protein COU90_01925 [Candidatus Ryanbacteria bacterium CG10_big_fil_rev_8_21_14_0_10_43_42]
MENPIVERKYIFFSSARVILNDNLFLSLVKKKAYSYIVGVSHKKLPVGPDIKIKHKKTINIYLNGTFDDIFKKFNDTSRNEIRKTFNMKEYFFKQGDVDMDAVYALYKPHRIEKKLEVRRKSFLAPCLIFTAYYNNELISVITCYDAKPYLRIQNIFSKLSNDDKEIRRITGYASRRLVYELCKYGNQRGYILLDMASANFTDPGKAGITQFKNSFGGRIEDEYIYTYRNTIPRILGNLKTWIKR